VTSLIQEGDVVAGKYRVDRVLGEGGMGIVVAATHQHLDQRVALKCLLPSVAMRPEIVQRFIREARAAVKIQSEHVARVLDVGTLESGLPYMVMEYLEGEDLAQVIARRGPLPVQEAVGYVLQACEAVAEAHALGIVHRDLKPANLFLAKRPSGQPTIKVLDFGISKVPSTSKEVALTSSTGIMGSPGYMSPEQMMATIQADARSDIWSFGIVLHEMLTCELPFDGDTMPEIVAAVLQKPHARLAASRTDTPSGVQDVVDRCLEKDPARRYGNVAELARALAPFGPVRAGLSVERIEHVLGLSEALPPAPMRSPSASRPERVLGLPETMPSTPVYRDPVPRIDSPTFAAMTSQASGRASRRLLAILPVALIVVAGGVGLLLAARRGRSVEAPQTSTSLVASAASLTPATLRLEPAPTASEPSASAAPSSPPSPAPLSSPPPTSSGAPGKLDTRPRWPAHGPTAAPRPSAAPVCHVVSFFDADGNKHFKRECP
jgi:serine/threonine protein kinase